MMQQSKRHGKTIGVALVLIAMWSAAALWSWNTFAAEILGLPEMAFRHAIALGILGVSAGLVLATPSWIAPRDILS